MKANPFILQAQAISSLSQEFPAVDFRTYQTRHVRSGDLAQAMLNLKEHWQITEVLLLEVADYYQVEKAILSYDEIKGTPSSGGLYTSRRPVNGIVLTKPKQTVLINHGNSPLVMLSSKSKAGPVIVLVATLDSLVPEQGDSIITCCLRRYLKDWGFPESVEVSFTSGNHFVPLPQSHEKITLIGQSYDRVYREAESFAGRQELFSQRGLNLAVILVSQLASYGLHAKHFLEATFDGGNGASFVTRKS